MTSPNKQHQSGHARAYIKQEWNNLGSKLYVTLGDMPNTCIIFDKGAILVKAISEAAALSSDDVCFEWGEMMDDTVVDIWKAIGKALEVYSDDPSQAYKQGYAEGESKVLREWNQSLHTPGPTDADKKAAIEKELLALKDEITRIAMLPEQLTLPLYKSPVSTSP